MKEHFHFPGRSKISKVLTQTSDLISIWNSNMEHHPIYFLFYFFLALHCSD